MQRTFAILLLLAGLCFAACNKVDEPVFEGRYYIENNTGVKVQVQAKDGADFLVLENSSIAIGATELMYTDPRTTVGTVLPSSVFTELKVFVRVGIKDSVIYQGVRNSDWDNRESGEDFESYYLTIN